MKKLLILLFVSLAVNVFSQYSDPNIAQPTSGYGSDGTHTVDVIAFVNPHFPAKDIEIYHPADIATPVPTIFYSHAYGGNISANISGLLQFVAKKGYAIVFVPYQTTGVTVTDRYMNLLDGFRKAARDYPNVIDTTRVGFLGHSFGGGASFGNSYACFTENNWGSNGRFIYALAQWYCYNLTQTQLQSFPSDTKLLTEIFEDDVTNDHRLAADLFTNINIAAAEKDYLLLKGDTINGYIYVADHVVPNTAAAFDAFDYYAYYRLLDALCDYTFNGSLAGKNVALGNGSPEQVTLPGGLRPLEQTDAPFVSHPQSQYEFPCNDSLNLRVAYCPAVELGLGEQMVLHLQLFPNPASDHVQVTGLQQPQPENPSVWNAYGQRMTVSCTWNTNGPDIQTAPLPAGVYFVRCGTASGRFIKE